MDASPVCPTAEETVHRRAFVSARDASEGDPPLPPHAAGSPFCPQSLSLKSARESFVQMKRSFQALRALLIVFERVKANHKLAFNNRKIMSSHTNILIRLVLLGKCNQADSGPAEGVAY